MKENQEPNVGGGAPAVPPHGREFPVAAHGATGIAVAAEILRCPARVHSGWREGSDMEATIWRAAPGDTDRGADTRGIQAAIDAAAGAGGGRVVVTPGDYLIAGLDLRDGVDLHLERDARLWASPEIGDYLGDDAAMLRGEEIDRAYREAGGSSGHSGQVTGDAINRAVIRARGVRNAAITGEGSLSGQGGAFFIPWWRADCKTTLVRPMSFIEFDGCRNVRVEGVRILDSCGWTLVFRDCESVHVRNAGIRCLHGPNVDGIDLFDTSKVVIEDCDIFTTDDGICLKSARPDGVVSDVRVRDCRIRTLCNVFKIGTETLGVVRNVDVAGIRARNYPTDLRDAESGLNLNSCDGGVVENIRVRDFEVADARSALHLYVGRRSFFQRNHREPSAGVLRDIVIEDFRGRGIQGPSFILGLPESPVSDVELRECAIHVAGGWSDPPPAPPPGRPEGYPGIKLYQPPPAAALWVRHARAIRSRNLSLTLEKTDTRPLVRTDGVADCQLDPDRPQPGGAESNTDTGHAQ